MFAYSDTREVVDSMNDLYHIGTFVHIHEIQDLEEYKMRMIVMAHRRIAMTAVFADHTPEEEKELEKEAKS